MKHIKQQIIRPEIVKALGKNKHYIEKSLLVKNLEEFNKVFAKYVEKN